jgi:hypothetical protein
MRRVFVPRWSIAIIHPIQAMKTIITFTALVATAALTFAADEAGKKKEESTKKSEAKEEGQKKPGPRDMEKQQDERFAMLDTNKDGDISKEEFNASPMAKGEGAAEHFKKLDRNHDDKLTKREFTARIQERPGDRKRGEGDKPDSKKTGEGDKPGTKKSGEGDKPGEKKPEAN